MALGSYIPEYAGMFDAYNKLAQYNQQQGVENIMREQKTSRRRTSDYAPEAIAKYNTEFGLQNQQMLSQLMTQEAGLGREERLGAQAARQQEAMTFGGQSQYGGGMLQGQLPWQAGQSEIQRAWQSEQNQKQWDLQKDMMEKQANQGLLGSIFGGIGSILGGNPFGIFGQSASDKYYNRMITKMGGEEGGY